MIRCFVGLTFVKTTLCGQYKSAEGLAPITVSGYERDLRLWIEYQGEIDILEIASQHILSFLNYPRTEYVPRQITWGIFRKLHTFAITYVRSGGDIFTLESLLGHSSLDMVEHYARIVEVDVEQAHRKASPADNWRL